MVSHSVRECGILPQFETIEGEKQVADVASTCRYWRVVSIPGRAGGSNFCEPLKAAVRGAKRASAIAPPQRWLTW